VRGKESLFFGLTVGAGWGRRYALAPVSLGVPFLFKVVLGNVRLPVADHGPLRNSRFWLRVQASRIAAVPTGPWLSTVYHPCTCIAITASATELVNAPSPQLLNGRAALPNFLRLSNNFGESHAPTGDQSQTRPDEGSYLGHGAAAFSGVVDGHIAGAGDDGPVLASDAM